MIAQIDISKEDQRGRIIEVEISEVNYDEGKRILKEVQSQLGKNEWVYQICAPCNGSKLLQPFYDFFNGFYLLESEIWGFQEINS